MNDLMLDVAAAHADAGTDPSADLAALAAMQDPAVARLFADAAGDGDVTADTPGE